MVPYVLVARREDLPVPPVPAGLVKCTTCGYDCWLSNQSGPETVGLAASFSPTGDCNFVCTRCEAVLKTAVLVGPLLIAASAWQEFIQMWGQS